jgi:metallophosphoesterase superfamily enzyme
MTCNPEIHGQNWALLACPTLPLTNKNTWELRHLPPEEEVYRPFLAGHLHPGYRLHGKGRDSLRCPCWVVSEKRIILPAFGSFTGLKNIKHEEDDKFFLTNGKEIQELG